MGFYGNITNTSRTQFSFDRKYSNRFDMDSNCSKDGVYAGRYVLIEYDEDLSKDTYNSTYFCVNNKMYTAINTHNKNFVGAVSNTEVTDPTNGQVVRIEPNKRFFNLNTEPLYVKIKNVITYDFERVSEPVYNEYCEMVLKKAPSDVTTHGHIVNGKLILIDNRNSDATQNSNEITPVQATLNMIVKIPEGYSYSTNISNTEYWKYVNGAWKQIATIQTSAITESGETVKIDNAGKSNFLANFQIDVEEYGSSRGYDSTVWQKVYTNGSEKYVMIAELNTVVPTFDVVADAPSIVPISPHFDSNSTNVYYKLHWQPQWGFRMKAANNGLMGPKIDSTGAIAEGSDVVLSTDKVLYPSDQKTSWHGKFYDSTKAQMSNGFYHPSLKRWVTQAYIDKIIEENVDEEGNTLIDVDKLYEDSFDAAIYYNKAGFNPEVISYSEDFINSKNPKYNAAIANSGWKNEDKISIAPTGLSGHSYNPHTEIREPQPQEDTQELSIMLPALGDSIAQIWDIVYGGRDVLKKTDNRNLDIAWENAYRVPERAGLRLVNEDYGTAKATFRPEEGQVNTLAGCINSVHDLMGMIIVDNNAAPDNIDIYANPAELDIEKIYYDKRDQSFKRKKTKYNYTDVSYVFEKVSLTKDDYSPNIFYTSNNNNAIATGEFNSNQQYWKKVINPEELYSEIIPSLTGYVPNCYTRSFPFYLPEDVEHRNPLYEYELDQRGYGLEGVRYYRYISATTIDLTGIYEPNKFYYPVRYADDNNDYDDTLPSSETCFYLSTDENAVPTHAYYDITLNKDPINHNMTGDGVYDDTEGTYDGKPLKYLYLPGYFYYIVTDDKGKTSFYRENTDLRTWTSQYLAGSLNDRHYVLLDQEAKKSETNIYVPDADGNMIQQTVVDGVIVKSSYKVQLIPFESGKYYFIQGYSDDYRDESGNIYSLPKKYCVLTEQLLKNHYAQQFTILKEDTENASVFYDYHTIILKQQGTFYAGGRFWYRNDSGNYVIDKSNKITLGRQYYSALNFSPISAGGVYVPNKYYYKDNNGVYHLDTSPTITLNRTYFRKNTIYVREDSFNLFPPFSEWSHDVLSVPASVTLATRDEYIVLEELQGFARTLNTIHGLILKINQIMEFGDVQTRDTTTVQGSLNKLNDAIAKFDALIPGQFTIIDDYGRLHSSPWTTKQANTPTNWGVIDSTYNRSEKEDQWIYAALKHDPVSPKITWKHQFNRVDDTTTISDKNIAVSGSKGRNNNTNDTLVLYSPIVDSTGHVVGKNLETVTLPYSFKTFAIGAQSTAVTDLTANTTSVVADNTKDTFTFASGNKWIKFAGDAANDKITIGHEVHGFTSGAANTWYGLASNETIATLDTDNTFEVPRLKFDEAGHITAAETHTVVLPENFTTISTTTSTGTDNSINGAKGSVAADNLTDTLTFAEGNKWINLTPNADSDTITISHYVNKFTPTTNTQDFNSTGNTFAVRTVTWDNAGHLTGSDTVTYTLPNNFKTFTVSNSGSSATTTNQTGSSGVSLTATTVIDTGAFDTGNRWLILTGDATNKKLTLSHAAAGTASTSKGDTANQTPNFGSTFKVLSAGIDQAGHVSSLEEHTVKIPSGSYKNTGNTGVITSIGFIPSTGAITSTSSYLGAVALGSYTAATAVKTAQNNQSITDCGITSTSLLSTALQTLDSRIMVETKNRIDAITNLDYAGFTSDQQAGKVIINVTETDGVINANQSYLGSITLGSYTAASDQKTNANVTISASGITTTSSLSSALQTLDTRIMTETKNRMNAIDALDYTDSAVTGEFVSSVTESNGIISVSRVALAPSITIGAGTADNAPTINVTVNTKSGTAQSITKASTSVFGVTKLSDSVTEDSSSTAATSKAVKIAYDKANAAVVANTGNPAGTYFKVTVDSKGLVTSGETALTASDIPELTKDKITDLGSMAGENTDNYVTKDLKYEYKYQTPAEGTPTEEENSNTIQWLFKKVAELEMKVYNLEHPDSPITGIEYPTPA